MAVWDQAAAGVVRDWAAAGVVRDQAVQVADLFYGQVPSAGDRAAKLAYLFLCSGLQLTKHPASQKVWVCKTQEAKHSEGERVWSLI